LLRKRTGKSLAYFSMAGDARRGGIVGTSSSLATCVSDHDANACFADARPAAPLHMESTASSAVRFLKQRSPVRSASWPKRTSNDRSGSKTAGIADLTATPSNGRSCCAICCQQLVTVLPPVPGHVPMTNPGVSASSGQTNRERESTFLQLLRQRNRASRALRNARSQAA